MYRVSQKKCASDFSSHYWHKYLMHMENKDIYGILIISAFHAISCFYSTPFQSIAIGRQSTSPPIFTHFILHLFKMSTISCNAFVASKFNIQNSPPMSRSSRPTALSMLARRAISFSGHGVYTLDLRQPHTQQSRGFKSGDRAGQFLPRMDLFDATRSPNCLSRYAMVLSFVWHGALSSAQYRFSKLPPLIRLNSGNTLC